MKKFVVSFIWTIYQIIQEEHWIEAERQRVEEE